MKHGSSSLLLDLLLEAFLTEFNKASAMQRYDNFIPRIFFIGVI